MATRKRHKKTTKRRKTRKKATSTAGVKTQLAHVIKSLQTIKKHV